MEDMLTMLRSFIGEGNVQVDPAMADKYVEEFNKEVFFYDNLLGIVYSKEFSTGVKQVAATLLYTQFKIHKRT